MAEYQLRCESSIRGQPWSPDRWSYPVLNRPDLFTWKHIMHLYQFAREKPDRYRNLMVFIRDDGGTEDDWEPYVMLGEWEEVA